MEQVRKWSTTARRVVFSGGPVSEIAIESVVLPTGEQIADYYQVRLADYALVFAVTEADDVLLLRQYKHGVGRVCVGFPGGALAGAEPPLMAAQRELLEETGHVSPDWRSLGSFVTNGNQRCNVAHLFVARGCRKVAQASAPDVERPELFAVGRRDILSHVTPADIGEVSHAALLALATHPTLCR